MLRIMKIHKILIPTDFSPLAKGAFTYGLHVAQALGAEVEVLHVYRGDFGVPVPEVMAYQMLDSRRQHAENLLKAFVEGTSEAEQALQAEVKLSLRCEMGLAVDTILELAEDENFDLIIMGTKGEHNFAEKVFGSITTNVLRSAQIPVLAVPEGAHFQGIKNLVYALDLSAPNLDNLAKAEKWAAAFEAQMQGVHVDTNSADDALEASAWAELKGRPNLQLHQVKAASVTEGLESFIDSHNADLLAMVHRQRGWFERMFHSSQTQKIALGARLPLLIFQG